MAASSDAETIASHRRSMFLDMGYRDAAALDAMVTAFLPWLRAKMDTGEYLAWLAMAEDGSVAAGACPARNGIRSVRGRRRSGTHCISSAE